MLQMKPVRLLSSFLISSYLICFDPSTVASRFYRQISAYLAPSPFNPKPLKALKVKVLPNGLESVEEGVALLKDDKVHGEKLVYLIAETPAIRARGA